VKEKSRSFIEGASESATACMLAMVQGNLLAITVSHLLIATQTGIIAGAIAFVASMLVRLDNVWVTPVLLGLFTALVDYFMHPGSFGGAATEAIVTGVVATLLSFVVTAGFKLKRQSSLS
jgi:hypothetical protein